MYSQPGPGGPIRGGRAHGRYMKGRLPEGVDFAAYPGRSSTPLPTAESKSAERINQLKIWNEAATNDEKRRLNTVKSKQALAHSGSGSRRTDSFKEAKERHSASFHSDKKETDAKDRDIYANRSDSDSDAEPQYEETRDHCTPGPDVHFNNAAGIQETAGVVPTKHVEDVVPANTIPHASSPSRMEANGRPIVHPTESAMMNTTPPTQAYPHPNMKPNIGAYPNPPTSAQSLHPGQSQRKEKSACCTIQ